MTEPPSAAPLWLRRYRRVIALLEDGLLILLLSTMILLATTQIALRNIWDSGIVWGDPLTKVLVLWIALLGAMAATRDGRHISIDLLSRFLPPKAKTVSLIISDLFAATVCGVLAYHAARLVLIDRDAGTLVFATIPTWVSELIIPIGFGVMALRFLGTSLTTLYRLLRTAP